MLRLSLPVLALLTILVGLPGLSAAQNPHFTSCSAVTTGGVLVLTGQIAGLGNQQRPPTPLVLQATALAVCLDAATTPPTVVDSTLVADGVTFPPKNGNRVYTFALDAPFVLPCDPPNEVVFVAVQTCDVTHDICCPEPVVPEP